MAPSAAAGRDLLAQEGRPFLSLSIINNFVCGIIQYKF
jgi:hypothetical protein